MERKSNVCGRNVDVEKNQPPPSGEEEDVAHSSDDEVPLNERALEHALNFALEPALDDALYDECLNDDKEWDSERLIYMLSKFEEERKRKNEAQTSSIAVALKIAFVILVIGYFLQIIIWSPR